MKVNKKSRSFLTGIRKKEKIIDVGKILLKKNEMVTFVTKNNSKHEVTKKEWGFYATQSINHRLKKKFKTALVINSQKRIYIMMVEKTKMKLFKKYCKLEKQEVLIWLDEIT